MAITGTKAFTSGEVLTANDVNQYLMRGVKVFSSTAVRDAAYGGAGEPVLEEGETAFITGTDTLQVYGGTALGWLDYRRATAGQVLQVVSTTKTDTFTTTSTSYTDVTGLSVSITPSSADSKVLVVCDTNFTVSGDISLMFQLVRGSTAIAIGDAAGSRTRASYGFSPTTGLAITTSGGLNFLDSPATTSATTYKIQTRVNAGSMFLNRQFTDTDSSVFFRSVSTITAMEISA